MNFSEYEQKYEALYDEFAGTVKSILETAIAAASPEYVPCPQTIQFRAKEASHLKRKLEARGLGTSDLIEAEIKDLSGVRLIFYTNIDVDRFLNSRLIPETFSVDWDETRVHHPTPQHAEQRYQAIHYTVRLGQNRSDLPEYKKFTGLRCEIQIQTVLNHAWAETSHDFLYHDPLKSGSGTVGFGTKARGAIEKRMARIMDEYLAPAGYEFAKVQHDIERLMQGKALFDRGALQTLATCTDNNARHETISAIKDFVVPNYDDIGAVYPEICGALVDAALAARQTSVIPITSPFGDIPGKTAAQITDLVLDVIDMLRYVNVGETFRRLVSIYKDETDTDQRKHVSEIVERLARYDLRVWEQAGLYVQTVLFDEIALLASEDRMAGRNLELLVWKEILSTDLRGTTFSENSVTISTGAVPASGELAALRNKAIEALFALYHDPAWADKEQIFAALMEASRLPSQARYSNELCKLVIDDTAHIFDALKNRLAGQPYSFLEHIEHDALVQFRRARDMAQAPEDKFECRASAEKLMSSILALRDNMNANSEFVRYKTLVGYQSVFLPQWDQDNFDYQESESYRTVRIAEFIDEISHANEAEWYSLLERCAATKSNDLATFPHFAEFLRALTRAKPAIALRLLERGNENLLVFLPAFLTGLFESGNESEYRRIIDEYLNGAKHLSSVARHLHIVSEPKPELVVRVSNAAIAAHDDIAVQECIALVVKKYSSQDPALVGDVFIPGIEYATTRNDVRWVRAVWFLNQAERFFAGLSKENADRVLYNLRAASKFDFELERILALIAAVYPAAVWDYFQQRLMGHDGADSNEAIGYRFQSLDKVLSKNVDLAVDTVRKWYRPDDPLFRFSGARLMNAVFPDFPAPFAAKLLALAHDGNADDLAFVVSVVENYHGEVVLHPVLMAVVDRLQDGDPLLPQVEICLQSTGVVVGEFGFVDAFQQRKSMMASWETDPRPRIRRFAERFIRSLEGRIAQEQRSAEQRREMRKRDFETD